MNCIISLKKLKYYFKKGYNVFYKGILWLPFNCWGKTQWGAQWWPSTWIVTEISYTSADEGLSASHRNCSESQTHLS